MDSGQGGRRRTLDQEDRSVNTVTEPGDLCEESAIGERCGEVGDRFAFDQDFPGDQLVPGRESNHLDVRGSASPYGVKQRRLMFRVIDSKSVKLTGHEDDDDAIVARRRSIRKFSTPGRSCQEDRALKDRGKSSGRTGSRPSPVSTMIAPA
jgi:hypothetical protein